MYEIYEKLIHELGLKTSDVTRATGISPSSFTDWKKGRCIPKSDKLQKIADYLGVSVDYLLTGVENNSKPSVSNDFTDDELEMIRLYRRASRLAQMQAFNILSNSVDEKRSEVMNA